MERKRTVTVKPSRIVIREELEPGQYMTLWLWRCSARKIYGAGVAKGINYVWKVGLYIGGRKAADRWKRGKDTGVSKITGNGSIKGLLAARRAVMDLFIGNMGQREELAVFAEDHRRLSAYTKLAKGIPNVEAIDEKGRDGFVYRNPKYWVWEE